MSRLVRNVVKTYGIQCSGSPLTQNLFRPNSNQIESNESNLNPNRLQVRRSSFWPWKRLDGHESRSLQSLYALWVGGFQKINLRSVEFEIFLNKVEGFLLYSLPLSSSSKMTIAWIADRFTLLSMQSTNFSLFFLHQELWWRKKVVASFSLGLVCLIRPPVC